jgi:hypothetical protein
MRACGTIGLVWLLAAVLLAAPARGQESLFGLQFLGTGAETGDARARGLGVLGIALDDTTTAVAQNPASLGSLRLMTLSLVALTGSRLATTPDEQARVGFARFPQIRVALPVFGRLVLGTGVSAFRNEGSEFVLPRRRIDGLGYVQRFERDGSLVTIPAVVAARLGRYVRLGVAADFLIGTLDERWVTEGDSILSLATRRRDEMDGTAFTFGGILEPRPWLRLGVAWSPAFDAERRRRTTVENAIESSAPPFRDTTVATDVRFPQVLRAGATVRLGRSWLGSADWLWREWSAYRGSLYEAAAARDENRVGAGIEYRPTSWVSYRAGFSRTTWGHEVGGAALQETAVHAGGGAPLAPGKGGVHFTLEHAWIGGLETNGYEERVWRFVLSVSGQEEWLRKSPRPR